MGELAAFVQSELRQVEIETTLSGGSCVTFGAGNDYPTDDLDLIADGLQTRKQIRAVMIRLGFREERHYFVHAGTHWFIAFPAGPLAVGEERPKDLPCIVLPTGTLRLLSPTDCVKDRLAGWLAVLRRCPVPRAGTGRRSQESHRCA